MQSFETPDVKVVDGDGKTVKYAGYGVFLDGKELIIPPLSVRQLRTYEAKIRQFGTITPDQGIERLGEILEVLHAAINRNYPDITLDALENMLDSRSLTLVCKAITLAAGFRPPKPGEEVPAQA